MTTSATCDLNLAYRWTCVASALPPDRHQIVDQAFCVCRNGLLAGHGPNLTTTGNGRTTSSCLADQHHIVTAVDMVYLAARVCMVPQQQSSSAEQEHHTYDKARLYCLSVTSTCIQQYCCWPRIEPQMACSYWQDESSYKDRCRLLGCICAGCIKTRVLCLSLNFAQVSKRWQ